MLQICFPMKTSSVWFRPKQKTCLIQEILHLFQHRDILESVASRRTLGEACAFSSSASFSDALPPKHRWETKIQISGIFFFLFSAITCCWSYLRTAIKMQDIVEMWSEETSRHLDSSWTNQNLRLFLILVFQVQVTA